MTTFQLKRSVVAGRGNATADGYSLGLDRSLGQSGLTSVVKVRKLTWRNKAGEYIAWIPDYVDQEGNRHIKRLLAECPRAHRENPERRPRDCTPTLLAPSAAFFRQKLAGCRCPARAVPPNQGDWSDVQEFTCPHVRRRSR